MHDAARSSNDPLTLLAMQQINLNHPQAQLSLLLGNRKSVILVLTPAVGGA
jgi:hypothetical protein